MPEQIRKWHKCVPFSSLWLQDLDLKCFCFWLHRPAPNDVRPPRVPPGPLHLTIYEKSCANPSQCGRSGQKYSAGVVFNYTNDCCDTDLCNRAGPAAALAWGVWLLAAAAALLLPWRVKNPQMKNKNVDLVFILPLKIQMKQ